jgi:DNA-binding NtrC family response regulator
MQLRLVALLALAFVLYVVASVGAAGGALDVGVLSLTAAAALSALAPLWVRPREAAGTKLVATLGVAQALGLAFHVAQAIHALAAEIAGALALSLIGALVFALAQRVPDEPPRLRKVPLLPVALVLSLAGALLGVLSAWPPIWVGERVWIAPHRWSLAPAASAGLCLLAALALRLGRGRLGSSARALAGSTWAALGIGVALLAFPLSLLLDLLGHALASALLLALAAAALLLGHAWTLSPSRAQVAGGWARELCAAALALACSLALAVLAARQLGALAWWSGLPLVLVYALVASAARPFVTRLFAPSGGRLLRAVREARQQARQSVDYTDLASRVLKPLRRAGRVPESAPLLVSFDPARIAQLDAAGFARLRDQQLPPALVAHLQKHPGEPIVLSELRSILPRRPELGPLVRALQELDALCVLPLIFLEQLEGALLIARGKRRDRVALEELLALEQLTLELAPLAAGFRTLERAHTRADRAERARAELALGLEEQALQLAELRAQAAATKAALGLPLSAPRAVQYSPSMRALSAQLESVAPHDVPVYLWAETGVAVAPVAHALHLQSGRGSEPFVIFDCAALPADAARARLFGVGSGASEQPGLCELIDRGTLLLSDVAALDGSVQRALTALLEERVIRPLNSHASHTFQGRLMVTATRPLRELVEASALTPELARWLERSVQRVPPLRERPEDLESLLLMALDRAARVHGKPARGVDGQALRALLEYTWPGNDAELASVVERAVIAAPGPRIALRDLPPFAPPGGRVIVSSFVDQEREILRRALALSYGDRTRAARSLGLKRAVFVEKLRELGVDDPTTAEN